MKLIEFLAYAAGIMLFWLLDRITKTYSLEHYIQTPLIINKYLSLTTEFNQGSSCGILSGNSTFEQLFLIIGPLILIAVVCAFHFSKNPVASSLIIVGGISNLYDRIIYPGVVDFIFIKSETASFPIFNIADIYISLGIILLLYQFAHDV